MKILKNAVLNIGVVVLSILICILLTRLDALTGAGNFQSMLTTLFGSAFLLVGLYLRFWATFLFHQNSMRVINLTPQKTLLTTGPYRFSRNPLYVGIVSIFFGVALFFGSPSAIVAAVLNFFAWNFTARIEEKELEYVFGVAYVEYKKEVPRWIRIGSIRI